MIRGYRQRAMLTQEALAERSFVSVRTIRNIESGQVVPQAASLRRLAGTLGLTAEETASLARDRAPSQAGSTGRDRSSVPTPNECSAVNLFLQLAAEAAPRRDLQPWVQPDIARICRRLNGLPVALELAAARLRTLSVSELADRLDHELADVGANDILEATVAWSYRLLDPAAQRLMIRLTRFPDGFVLDEAEELLSQPPLDRYEILPALASLVDHALVQARDGCRRTQYRLLESVRAYAVGLASTGVCGWPRVQGCC
jgi:predicted ATPase/DNA-binding XRE family transcriptional regulator